MNAAARKLQLWRIRRGAERPELAVNKGPRTRPIRGIDVPDHLWADYRTFRKAGYSREEALNALKLDTKGNTPTSERLDSEGRG